MLIENLINLMILGLQLAEEFTAGLLPQEMRIDLLYLGDGIKLKLYFCFECFGGKLLDTKKIQ
jgi:hypothetical protein